MELGRRSVLLDINYTGGDGSYGGLALRRFQKAIKENATLAQEPAVAGRITGVPEEAQP